MENVIRLKKSNVDKFDVMAWADRYSSVVLNKTIFFAEGDLSILVASDLAFKEEYVSTENLLELYPPEKWCDIPFHTDYGKHEGWSWIEIKDGTFICRKGE